MTLDEFSHKNNMVGFRKTSVTFGFASDAGDESPRHPKLTMTSQRRCITTVCVFPCRQGIATASGCGAKGRRTNVGFWRAGNERGAIKILERWSTGVTQRKPDTWQVMPGVTLKAFSDSSAALRFGTTHKLNTKPARLCASFEGNRPQKTHKHLLK